MPLFMAKKEVFAWIKQGRKTIDVRKGKPRQGNIAVFQSGNNHLRFPILKRETGKLAEIVRPDNFKQVIPPAENLQAALNYFHCLYGIYDGQFTAYYLADLKK